VLRSDELDQKLIARRPTGTSTWRISLKYNVLLDSGPLAQAMKIRHPQNRKYIAYRNAVRGETSHGGLLIHKGKEYETS